MGFYCLHFSLPVRSEIDDLHTHSPDVESTTDLINLAVFDDLEKLLTVLLRLVDVFFKPEHMILEFNVRNYLLEDTLTHVCMFLCVN